MKFKISSNDLEILLNQYTRKKDVHRDYVDIEMEPQWDTATEAMFDNERKAIGYRKGYDDGYREGWYAKDNCHYRNGNYCYRKCCCGVLCNPLTCRFDKDNKESGEITAEDQKRFCDKIFNIK